MQSLPKEVKITLKGGDSRMTKKHLTYYSITVEEDDETLQNLIRNTKEEFKGEIEEVIVTIKVSL